MTRPDLKPIHGMPGFMQEYYRRYLPSAFDPSMNIYEQMIQVIEHLNQMNLIVGDIAEQWNILCKWIMNEGLDEAVRKKLQEWLDDGTLEKIINEEIFPQLDTITKDWINVKTPPKPLVGLKGDGSDETEAITNLLNACGDRNVYFPFGTYTVSDEVVITASNMNIQFSKGSLVTVIDNAPLTTKGLKASILVFTGNNVTIDGLTVHGNIQNNYVKVGEDKYYTAFPNMPTEKYVGYTGIRLGGNNMVLKNSKFTWLSWSAILVDTKRDDTLTNNILIDNCYCDKISEDQISIHRVSNVSVKNCYMKDPLHHGIHIYFKTNHVTVENNKLHLTRGNAFQFYPNQLNTEAWGGIGVDHASYPESDCKNTIVTDNILTGEFQFGIEVMGFAEDVQISNNIMKLTDRGDGVRFASPPQGVASVESNHFIGCRRGFSFFWNPLINPVGERIYKYTTLIVRDNQFNGSIETHLSIGESQKETDANPVPKMRVVIQDNNFKKGSSTVSYSLHMDTDKTWIDYYITGNDLVDGAISAYVVPPGKDYYWMLQYCHGNIGMIYNNVRTDSTNPTQRYPVPINATEFDVVLPEALKQKDSSYDVLVGLMFDHGGVWIPAKTTTGFKIRWKNPCPFDSTTLGYMIVR